MPVQELQHYDFSPGAAWLGGIGQMLQAAYATFQNEKERKLWQQEQARRAKLDQDEAERQKLRNELAVRAQAIAEAQAPTPGARPTIPEAAVAPIQVRTGGPLSDMITPPGVAPAPSFGVERREVVPMTQPATEPMSETFIPPVSFGGRTILPERREPKVYEDEFIAKQKRLMEEDAISGLKGIRVTPEIHAGLPDVLKGMYPVNSVLPTELAGEAVRNLTKPTVPPRAPTTKMVRLPNGSEVPYEWNPATGAYEKSTSLPVSAPVPKTPKEPKPTLLGADVNWALRGDEFYNTLSPEGQELIGGMVDYTIDPARVLSLRGDSRAQAIAAARRVNKDFDMSVYPQAFATKIEYIRGATQKRIASLNQLADHLGVLTDAANALSNSDLKRVNVFVNWARDQFGDPTITDYQTASTAVAEEVGRLMRGGVGSDAQVKAWEKNFGQNASLDQQLSAIKTTARIVKGALGGIRRGWIAGTKSEKGWDDFLEPSAKALFGGASYSAPVKPVGPPVIVPKR